MTTSVHYRHDCATGVPTWYTHDARRLDTPSAGVPQNLVLLKLEPDRQPGLENPSSQLSRVDSTESRAEHDRTTPGEFTRANDFDGPIEIGPTAQDKFDLVDRLESIEVECRKRAIDRVELVTTDPPDRALIDYLVKRAKTF